MRHIALEIAYDGSGYSGWQIQDNALTIQGVIEEKLSQIAHERLRLSVAGRTDAKVHAVGQIASFRSSLNLSERTMQRALNALLPKDIRINRVFEVSGAFHPRFSARGRWYRYLISNVSVPIPFLKNYALWMSRSLRTDLLNEYSERIIGSHDFTSFATLEEDEVAVRDVYHCKFRRWEDFVVLDIVANGFLRKMVRTIVGTFLKLEKEAAHPERVDEILSGRSRSIAGMTASPLGLYLMKVYY
jgi:tRNA pseudouridine38-40 synthase